MDGDNQYISISSGRSDEKYEKAKKDYLRQFGIGVPKQKKEMAFTPEMIEEQVINTGQIVFEVTDACNLRCKYCGYGNLYYDHDERYNSKMTFRQVKPFLDYLEKVWTDKSKSLKKIVFISFYGDEPLLNMPFIKDMVAYTQEKETSERRFRYSMTTNAVLLHKYMYFLAEHRFHLLISLDGDT